MTFRFASLGSGSSGNATVVAHGSGHETRGVLVDCGFSAKEAVSRLSRLDMRPEQISAVLVTHEHGDHAKGVSAFSRKYDIPVYMTQGTCLAGAFEHLQGMKYVLSGTCFEVAGISILPVTVPHDAREPVQYVFTFQGTKLGILTDLGSISTLVVESYSECDALLLEANHDPVMLANGPYPRSLQQRVGGAWGHLSNQQCKQLLYELSLPSLRHLVLGHISQKNNSIESVQACLGERLSSVSNVIYACQDRGFDWVTI